MKGVYPRSEERRLSGMMLLDGGARAWKVTHDPSGYFRGVLFRLSDVLSGGFDPGTTFVHIHDKRMKYVVNAAGQARKAVEKKRGRKARKQRRLVLSNGSSNRSTAAPRARK